jgi:hypothetical protein
LMCSQTCCKLFYQTCQNLISTSLLQVDETSCIKSANVNLQQAWFSQLASALMRSSDLLQVVLSGLLQVDDVNKPAATCWQLAAGR